MSRSVSSSTSSFKPTKPVTDNYIANTIMYDDDFIPDYENEPEAEPSTAVVATTPRSSSMTLPSKQLATTTAFRAVSPMPKSPQRPPLPVAVPVTDNDDDDKEDGEADDDDSDADEEAKILAELKRKKEEADAAAALLEKKKKEAEAAEAAAKAAKKKAKQEAAEKKKKEEAEAAAAAKRKEDADAAEMKARLEAIAAKKKAKAEAAAIAMAEKKKKEADALAALALAEKKQKEAEANEAISTAPHPMAGAVLSDEMDNATQRMDRFQQEQELFANSLTELDTSLHADTLPSLPVTPVNSASPRHLATNAGSTVGSTTKWHPPLHQENTLDLLSSVGWLETIAGAISTQTQIIDDHMKHTRALMIHYHEQQLQYLASLPQKKSTDKSTGATASKKRKSSVAAAAAAAADEQESKTQPTPQPTKKAAAAAAAHKEKEPKQTSKKIKTHE